MAQPLAERMAPDAMPAAYPAPRPGTLRTATAAPALSLRPMPRDAWAAPALRWDGHPRDMDWTLAAMAALRGAGGLAREYRSTRHRRLVPGLRDGRPPAQRRAFWAGLVSALAWHESTHREEAVGGGGRWFGLVQILAGDGALQGLCGDDGRGASGRRGQPALRCQDHGRDRVARPRGVGGHGRRGG